MGVPNVYRRTTEGALINYDYVDLGEGTGIVQVYGFGSDQGRSATASGGVVLYLDRNQIEAGEQAIVNPASGSLYTRRTTIEGSGKPNERFFELSEFNLPKLVKGNMYVTFTWAIVETGGSSNVTAYATVKLYKNDTEIATADTSEFKTSASQTTIITSNVRIPVPLTRFKIGDILKVSFQTTVPSGQCNIYLHHDPNDNDFTDATPNITAATNTTALKVYIPFRIDI